MNCPKKRLEAPPIFVDRNCFFAYSFGCVFSALPGTLGHRRMREDGEAARNKTSYAIDNFLKTLELLLCGSPGLFFYLVLKSLFHGLKSGKCRFTAKNGEAVCARN